MDSTANKSSLIITGRAKPFQFQKDGVRMMEGFLEKNSGTLLADSMGLGKTLQVLWTLVRNREKMLPALVICPSSVKYNWAYEARRHIGLDSSICEGRRTPEASPLSAQVSPLTIINYDILTNWKEYLSQIPFKTIVMDECQNLQNRNTKRTIAAQEMSTSIKNRIALSGTPISNRPSELWPTLNILWPEEYPSFWSYADQFCEPKWTRFGWQHNGSANLDVLNADLLRHGMVRRRKKEVLKDLPDKMRRIVHCQIEDVDEYNEATNDFLNWLKKHAGEKVHSAKKAIHIVKIGYLLRLVAKLKMRSVVDWANDFLENSDEKLVMMGVHRKALDVLQRRVHAKSVRLDGSTSPRGRKLAVDQFQRDSKTRLFIGNIKAAGTGITLTAASTLAFVELYWRPADHTQAEDRIHRISQEQTAWINYMIAGNTIEERLCQLLQKKQLVLSAAIDGGKTPEDLNIYDILIEELQGIK